MQEVKNIERRYCLDVENIHGSRASLSALVAVRKCYVHNPAGNEHSALDTSPEEHILQVRECCASAEDYLLPDTPIKYAVFRVFVARGNEPLTAREISADLRERWADNSYPRDLSVRVLQRILDSGANYFIHEVPEPSPDEQIIRRQSEE